MRADAVLQKANQLDDQPSLLTLLLRVHFVLFLHLLETTDGTKLLFADESWLLFRQSGTEPMLRIYAEATSVAKVDALLNAGVELAANLS